MFDIQNRGNIRFKQERRRWRRFQALAPNFRVVARARPVSAELGALPVG